MTIECPVCDGCRSLPFLQRESVPVHQNLVMGTQAAARMAVRGELDFVICEDCGFVFNRAFELSRLSYGSAYENTQSCSSYFDSYLEGLIDDLVDRQGVRNCVIVEVGCGNGTFLRKLVSRLGAGNKGFGFDPSYVGPASDLEGRLNFRTCYYDASCHDVDADVVICRHVIEHVPEPMEMLRSLRSALDHSAGARLFFETPCVEWILRKRVIWDFFYEHCSLFTASSLALAFQRAGFAVDQVRHQFGRQYLWLEARVAAQQKVPANPHNSQTAALALAYGKDETELRRQWLAKLLNVRHKGKVALWGAGAKGATFANLVDPGGNLIDCIVDVNPKKQGCYIPGSGHPIVAPHQLSGRGVTSAVLMNPNYREEIFQLLANAGIKIDLVDWSH